MYLNKYRICGCNFEIKSEEPLQPARNYPLFASEFETADYSLNVHKVTDLPSTEKELTYTTHRRKIYGNEQIITYTAYQDFKTDEYVYYACCVGHSDLYINFDDHLREDVVFDGMDLLPMLIKKGIGLLHSSFIDVNDGAVLFVGKKQVGKSTQAALWEKYENVTIINGDRAGIYYENGVYYADGVPFCGTSNICVNKKLPLKAIVCLSKGIENKLQLLTPIQGFLAIYGHFSYYSRLEDVCNITELATGICENVPIYRFECLKNQSAVELLKKELKELF
jgi:hypothetical protein